MPSAATRPVRSTLTRLAVVATLGLGTVMGTGAAALADPTDASEGRARLISTDLLGAQLVDAVTAESGNPSDPGPDTADIDATVLAGLLTVEVPGIGVPLIASGGNGGVLDLGGAADAGLLNSYSSSPTREDSVASSGALGADGALDLGAGSDPSTIGTTKLELTSLLDQLGVDGLTDDVVDRLTVDLGALASRAEATGVGTADRDYLLAGGRITLHSPAVDRLAQSLGDRVRGVQSTLDAPLADGGAVDDVLDDVDISLGVPGVASLRAGPATATLDLDLDAVLQDLLDEELVSTDGIVSVDLGDGTIQIDLAKLLKGPGATDLNGLDPDTDVLTAPTINAIGAGIADALGGLGESVGSAVTDAVNGADLTVDVPGQLTVGLTTTPLTLTVSGTLGGFAGAPGSTAPTVTIPDAVPGALADLLRPALTTAVVGGLRPVVGSLLTTTTSGLEPAIDALVATATTALQPLLDDVLPGIVAITINEQTDDEVLGQDSRTVRALSVDLLPELGTIAPIDLAESTVRVSDRPTLDATPDPVYPGGEVAVGGGGWTPGSSVDLVYTDAGGTVVARTDGVDVQDDGTIADRVTLPDGTSVGALSVTGTSSDGLRATTSVRVAAEPSLTATPDPVRQGGTVTVAGTGWPAGPVQLSYTDADGAVVQLPDATVGDDGVLDASFDLPDDVPLGNLVVDGTGADGADASDTVQVVAVPSVSASPDPVSYGGTVTASGAGWSPDAPVTVTFTDADGTVLGTAVVDPSDAGGFTTTLQVPPGTPEGPLTVTATQGTDRAVDTVRVEASPAVAASPDPVRPGDTVTTTGSGYPGGTDVEVTYTAPDGTVIDTNTVTTRDDGTFTDTLTVPASTPAGTLTVDADDGNDNTASDTVRVVVPAVTATPDPVGYGDDVTVTGEGWPGGETVSVTVEATDGTTIGTTDVTVRDDGTFTATVTVPPGTAPGQATVTATDGAGHQATDTTTVQASPAVQVGPDPVRPGDTVTTTGSGYPGGTDVEVTYTAPDGTVIDTHTVTTRDDGTFTDTLTVPAGTTPGTLTVDAGDGDGNTATGTTTVVTGAGNGGGNGGGGNGGGGNGGGGNGGGGAGAGNGAGTGAGSGAGNGNGASTGAGTSGAGTSTGAGGGALLPDTGAQLTIGVVGLAALLLTAGAAAIILARRREV